MLNICSFSVPDVRPIFFSELPEVTHKKRQFFSDDAQRTTGRVDMERKSMLRNYLTELKNILTGLNPYKAVLFGSYAYGEVGDDSDIDLIVVLDKGSMLKGFDEGVANYSSVKKYFTFLKHKVPMDFGKSSESCS